MANEHRDVIVVGGGIIGCLTAYFLARRGLKIALLEADAVGSHASGFAFGEMGVLEGAGIPDPLLEFSLWSMSRHHTLSMELKDVSGVDNQFQFGGRLKLAFNESEAASYQKQLEWQREVKDLDVTWLEPREVVEVEPQANPACLGGVYVQRAGAVEPYRLNLAAAQSAEKLGTEILSRRVTGLLTEGDRCLGVTFHEGQREGQREGRQVGRMEAGAVVLAMGPWSQEAAAWCGIDIPVTPLKGQILRLRETSKPIRTSLHYGGSYVVTKPDGLTWAGTTEEEVGFNEDVTPEARDKIMGDLLKMAPALASAELVQQTACLRPLSADGLPIVGRVPGWQNLYIGTGAGRKGILWSTGMSQGLAELILDGSSQVPGLEALNPARFQRD